MVSLSALPLKERGEASRGGHATRAIRSRRRSPQQRSLKGATPRLLAWFPGSISDPFGTVSRPPLRARGEEAISAREGFVDFLRVGRYTDTQKVCRSSEEPKATRFAVQPNG